MSPRLTQIVQMLATRVRVLTVRQAARTWWTDTPSGHRSARRNLSRAVEHGWLLGRKSLVDPVMELRRPVWTWFPGQATPDFDAIAYRLQARWVRPPREMSIFSASRRAGRRHAGYGGSLRQPLQVTHDLHVTEIYLHFLRTAPVAAAAWTGEDLLGPSRRGQKRPDAILVGSDGQPRLVIEFGGRYDAARVRAFHEDNVRRTLPYQLW